MMAAWMAFAAFVGTLLAGAALGAERVSRAVARPTRWVWSAALALTVVLTAVAPLRRADTPTGAPAYAMVGGGRPTAPTASFSSVATAAGARVIDTLAGIVPPALARRLGLIWLGLSGASLLCFAIVYRRVSRARRAWLPAEMHGSVVRVAPRAGPAVMGLVRPEIVVPAWLLRRGPDEQRLVIAHEREHVSAGDPRLLAAGCAAAVLLPWHPFVWWMLSRLRLAVEVDCDQRVLARGAGADAYGSLLIELAWRGPSFQPGALALADAPSHLERRLIAMTAPRSKTRLHTLLLGAAALAAVVAACESHLPTQSAPTTQANAASSSDLVHRALVVGALTERVHDMARAGAFPADGKAHRVDVTTADRQAANRFEERFNGLVFVDGVKRELADVTSSIRLKDIARVEVIKGPAAARLYTDPRAANGVIRITTREAAQQKSN